MTHFPIPPQNKKAFYTGSLSGANKAEQKHFASPVKEKVLVKKTASVCSNVRPMVAPEPDQKEPNDDNPNQPRSSNNSVVTEIREATSFDSDDTAEESSVAPPSKVTAEKREDLAISLHDGRIIVAPASSCEAVTSECAATAGENASTENCHNYASGDCWETVEVRGRGNRKKPSDRPQHSGSRHSHHSAATTGSHDLHGGSTRKSKVSRSTSSRKKIAAKKIVREILVSVVDSIEEESRRRKQSVPSAPRAVNSWKLGPPGTNQQGPAPRKNFAAVVANAAKRDTTLRDVVAGKRLDVQTTRTTPVDDLNKRVLRVEEATHAFASLKKVYDDYDRKSPGTKPTKCQTGIAADQNTAQTYQETVSASSNARASFRDQPQNTEDRKSDTSSGDTDEGPHNRDPESVSKADVKVVLTPPLPTLLSPENANSATSSVASSLEAPYAGRSLHHCVKAVDVNDVGYHLLDVCDRLSRDMSLFMSRRALALSARRRERGALLAALQDSVSSIWPGKCHVELYGSCATQLDLPASDIDVVVLGLDSAVAKMNSPPSQIVGLSRSKSASSESIGAIASIDAAGVTDEGHQHTVLHHMSTTPFGMIPVHLNAERVARLASDLEGQPWAVQVNAIPTASVPVVKVLADASKLARASHGGEWMAQHQHIAAQAAAKGQTLENRADQEYTNAQYILPALLPWRGSDVMKGLLSLDITFEGPEHGGIGSTEFSARTVAEACAESGLHPDATPFVQVLMVLKELLAQRKLNEPYSGGLSSYALLLLVLALVHERSVIREEIELVEQQKRAMATGALDAFDSGANDQSPSHVYNDHPSFSRSLVVSGTDHITKNYGQATTGVVGESCSMNKKHGVSLHVVSSNEHENGRVHSKKNAKKSHLKNRSPRAEAANPGYPASNSWATVAMKNSVNKASSAVNHSKQSEEVPRAENSTEKSVQKPSFADAAAKSAEEADAGSMFGNKVRSKIHDDNVANETTRDDGKIKSEAAWSYNSNPLNTKSATDASDSAAPTNCLKEGLKVSLCGSVLRVAPSFYPQGYNDIVEVLCSGETTAGKLLMHFLLFYGQHFDAQSTAIDISGKHERDFTGHAPPYSYLSPYIQRRALGNIDPITGMLTVDPIVIYDPLEGAENNNVARRCFAWNSVRWIFAQSYTTLASAVERSATPPATPGGRLTPSVPVSGHDTEAGTVLPSPDAVGDIMDPSSPLLRCLLSF